MDKIIIPTNKNLAFWVKTLIPYKDVYFFKNKPKFENVEIIDIDTYLSLYDSLEYNNAYCHWLMRKNAKYVIIDDTNWIMSLSKEERLAVYKEQIKLERGLIIENCEKFLNNKELERFVCDNKMILNNSYYELKYQLKKDILIEYVREQDDWKCCDYKIDNKELDKLANTFLNQDGTNCLAIVLYAITLDSKYLVKWVQQDEFEETIKNFTNISRFEVSFGDIAIFYNADNEIQHACFALGNNLFLNKNGQSKFNPILVKTLDSIEEDWNGLHVIFKRRA